MERIQIYLRNTIDENTTVQTWNPQNYLSIYLAGSFKFYLVELLEVKFLLIQPYDQSTVQKLKKQMNVISEKVSMPVALLLEESTRYRLKRMIQEKIPFVCADQQLYLPFLMLHIQKQKKAAEVELAEKFSPTTQLIYLALLYSNEQEFSLEEISKKLNVSVMSVVRGMNELVRRELLDCKIEGKTGRKKVFSLVNKKEYWNSGKEFLANPIRKIIYVNEIPENLHLLKSGLTALGEQTMLSEPEQMFYAAESKFEDVLKTVQISKEEADEEMLPAVQLMRYNITLLTETEYVDPVTMMLSLRERDERIEIALSELLEDKDWYEE